MGNFVQGSIVKMAIRELAAPIEDVSAFTFLVDDVPPNNPLGCIA